MRRLPGITHLECALIFLATFSLPFNGTMALRLTCLAGLLTLALLKRNRNGLAFRLEWPLALWFCIPPLSVLWSLAPQASARELGQDILYPLLAFLSLRLLATDERNYRSALWGSVLGLTCIVAIGSVRQWNNPAYDWYQLAHGWGQFSTLLVMGMVSVLVLMIQSYGNRQYKQLVGVAVLGAGFLLGGYLMQNRMFWLSTAVICAMASLFVLWRQEFAAQRKWLLGVLSCAGFALLGLFWLVARSKPANYLDTSLGNSVGASLTHNERFELWAFWLNKAMEHPWLGIGFGRDLPRDLFFHLKPENWHPMQFAHAHNVFVDVLVQMGFVGLACFVLMLCGLCALFMRHLRSPLQTGVAALAGISLVLGMLSKNLSDDFYTRTPLFMFWMLLGVMLAQIDKASRK